jgi:predicted lactoylglutathione lyase
MSKKVFISLPVADFAKSIAFYEALGFKRNPDFSDDTAAAMVWGETIYFMLLSHQKWREFTTRPIPPTASSEVAINLSCESKEEVDAMVAAAVAHGGTADVNPVQDLGFMYGRDLLDLDGHILGPMWMDPAAIPAES